VPVAPSWAAERVAAAVRDYGVTITAISPGLFKPTMRTDGTSVPVSPDTPGEVRRHLEELLPAFFAFAEKVGTRNINVFALPKAEAAAGVNKATPAIVTDSLSEAAEKARRRGFQLLLENVASSFADTAEAALALLQVVNSPALGLCWDPANVAVRKLSPDPVGGDYPILRPFVKGVHVKDVKFQGEQPAWCMLGEGVVDWPGQLRRLGADGYAGALTLEPHLTFQPGATNLVAMIEQYVARLRQMLHEGGKSPTG
jgi:sugar phosphate isomerase/epimerase